MKFGIGQPMRRHEDLRLITGRGRYTDDVTLPRMTHAFVLRSPAAHARDQAHRYASRATHARRVVCARAARTFAPTGLGDVPCTIPLNNRDGTPRHDTPRPVLARRQGAPRRPAGGAGGCRDTGRRARCRRSDRGRVRGAAGGDGSEGCDRRRRAAALRSYPRQRRLRLGQRHGRRGRRPRPRSPRPPASSRSNSSTTASSSTRWSRATPLPNTIRRAAARRSIPRRKARISCAIRSPRSCSSCRRTNSA